MRFGKTVLFPVNLYVGNITGSAERNKDYKLFFRVRRQTHTDNGFSFGSHACYLNII